VTDPDPLTIQERKAEACDRRSAVTWEGLNPPYRTIVLDPPWSYRRRGPRRPADDRRVATEGKPWPYSQMELEEISALPIAALADDDCRLYLWTTLKYLRHSWDLIEGWGFEAGRVLTWIKKPRGTASVTTEFLVLGKRGAPVVMPWVGTTWFDWPRGAHSEKPAQAYDLIESLSSGPYVDLFTRQTRLGWDSFGLGVEAQPEAM
jgi:N6-adenosine-specific RNA methylase IME4